MAGQGRSASRVNGETLKWDGLVRGPEMPGLRPDGKEWLPNSIEYYEEFRRSPQALKMGTDLDWQSVLDLVFLKDCFYRRPGAQMAAEIRARENAFGITPMARHALKWDAPDPNQMAAGGGAVVNDVSAERVDSWRRSVLGE
ncbi:hypothetical protein [Bifidobacterium choerinum]|uniref:phage terminase small subunit n=1 Tax=Bifidobacterium choerinum TaxID=35760 RepID=UPI0012E04A50|nr:hypothetical protein [Bifidobacterium choerinum]